MSKYFWEAIEQNLKGQKPTRLGADQLMECMGAGWSGKKETIDEVCGAIREMSSIYETDAKAKGFLKALDEATAKICEVMTSEGYNPKADDITIIASSKKIEGEDVDKEDKKEKEEKELDEETPLQRLQTGANKDSSIPSKRLGLEEDSDSYKSKLSLLAKKRKEKLGNVDEKKEVEDDDKKEDLDEMNIQASTEAGQRGVKGKTPLQRLQSGDTRNTNIPSSRMEEGVGSISKEKLKSIFDSMKLKGYEGTEDEFAQEIQNAFDMREEDELAEETPLQRLQTGANKDSSIPSKRLGLEEKKKVVKTDDEEEDEKEETEEKEEKKVDKIEESIVRRAEQMVV